MLATTGSAKCPSPLPLIPPLTAFSAAAMGREDDTEDDLKDEDAEADNERRPLPLRRTGDLSPP